MGTNLDMTNRENCTQNNSLEHSNELMQVDSVLQDNISNFDKSQISTNDNCMQYTLVDNQSSQTPSFVTVTTSQGQILQNLPMMLPTSQYSLKPIQPMTRCQKNVRILPNANKTPVSTIHSINNGTTSNAVIFSNATLLNTVTPQMIKTMPISTQFINSQGIVSASDFLTNELTNGKISDSITNTSNLINNQLSQLIKVNSNSLQTGNLHVMKTNPSSPTLKQTPIFTTSPTNYRKSLQISNVRSMTKSITKSTPKITSAVVLQNSSKLQDIRNNTSPSSILRTNSSPSSVSVLKQQQQQQQQPQKTFAKRIVNLQSLNNIANNVQNLQKTISLKTSNNNFEKNSPKPQEINQMRNMKNLKNIKSMPNVVLEKVKGGNYCSIKSTNCTLTNSTTLPPSARIAISKTKLNNISTNQIVTTLKSNQILKNADTSSKIEKPNKNQIPIITHSKGKTFIIDDGVPASQISQIIQKFNREQQNFELSNYQNNEENKEKVVYQIVYPNDLDLINRRAPATATTTMAQTTTTTTTNVQQKRPAKRGRPKKNTVKPQIPPPTKPISEEDRELKNERKKVIARTRSGRLSRPPKHMVRDYKHLHPVDFTQPDLDDSDGGYSDYNTNGDVPDDDETPKELLTGLEIPKRKVSKEYLCPTCSKTYLGREKMIFHFEKYPSHGNMDQLPPAKPKTDVNQSLDTLKRKGKKRGPWGTPEEKSARRQEKLKNAIAVCEKNEISNIAAKPVLNSMSLFDLIIMKSENNVMNFMHILKDLMNNIREKATIMLTPPTNDDERNNSMDLNDDLLCDALGLNPGLYKINNNCFHQENSNNDVNELSIKKAKIENIEHHLEERASSGFSDGSDSSSNCPDVLTALTLVPRINNDEPCKLIGSKLVISNPEIQNELCENGGFRKIDISNNGFQKFDTNDQFIKLQSTDKKFIKLENGIMGAYHQNHESEENSFEMQNFANTTENFNKSFQTSNENNTNIFDGLENLEVKMNYDHLAQLAMLNATGEMEHHHHQSHITEQIEQIVSDKLSDMIPGDLLENNLISNNSISSDISFAFNSSLTEEYPFRSIRS